MNLCLNEGVCVKREYGNTEPYITKKGFFTSHSRREVTTDELVILQRQVLSVIQAVVVFTRESDDVYT